MRNVEINLFIHMATRALSFAYSLVFEKYGIVGHRQQGFAIWRTAKHEGLLSCVDRREAIDTAKIENNPLSLLRLTTTVSLYIHGRLEWSYNITCWLHSSTALFKNLSILLFYTVPQLWRPQCFNYYHPRYAILSRFLQTENRRIGFLT